MPSVTHERGVCAAGGWAEPGPVRSRNQRRGGLVESDVAVGAEAENLQVDPAGAIDRALVAIAFTRRVARRPIQKVNSPQLQVDVIEEMALHERTVAAPIAP